MILKLAPSNENYERVPPFSPPASLPDFPTHRSNFDASLTFYSNAGYPAACSNHSPIPSLSSHTPSASPTPSATSFISTIPNLLTAYYSCTISSLAPTNVTASSFLPPAPLFSLFSNRLQPTSAKSSLIAKFRQRPIMLTKLIKSLSAHALLRAHSVTANDTTADTVPALHPKVT